MINNNKSMDSTVTDNNTNISQKTLREIVIFSKSKKMRENVNKSLYAYRLNISPNKPQILKYQKAYQYLKDVIDAINKLDFSSRNCKDERYFYFGLVSELSEKSKKLLSDYLKEKNFLRDEKNKIENITISLSNILSYKNLLDSQFDVKATNINERINNK